MPGLVHNTIVPQFSHWYRRPSWLGIEVHLCRRSSEERFRCLYFLLSGSPQQWMSPSSEPLVTTNSAPHLPQKYRFPVSVATGNTSFTLACRKLYLGPSIESTTCIEGRKGQSPDVLD